MYISILLIEKNSIYFLFKNCEKVIKIQNETAPLKKSNFFKIWYDLFWSGFEDSWLDYCSTGLIAELNGDSVNHYLRISATALAGDWVNLLTLLYIYEKNSM